MRVLFSFIAIIAVRLAALAARLGLTRRAAYSFCVATREWYASRHIVVIESDDWGRVRFTQKTLDNLQRSSVAAPQLKTFLEHAYHSKSNLIYDSLESIDDLEKLYSTLEKHYDSRGNHPLLTANIVVANPDCSAMQKNYFRKYCYYMPHPELARKWRDGMTRSVFYPQYHGSMHFNFRWWARDIILSDRFALDLLDQGITGLSFFTFRGREYRYEGEYLDVSVTPSRAVPFSEQQLLVDQGLDIFEALFGIKSLSTIAPFYMWDSVTEQCWVRRGIQYIQGAESQISGRSAAGIDRARSHYLGERNANGQIYLTRNCQFEPSVGQKDYWKASFATIAKLFDKEHAPAVINSHRFNYVSGVSSRVRDHTIDQLDRLLSAVEQTYPDVVYLTTPQLGELIQYGHFHDIHTNVDVHFDMAQSRRGGPLPDARIRH